MPLDAVELFALHMYIKTSMLTRLLNSTVVSRDHPLHVPQNEDHILHNENHLYGISMSNIALEFL